MFFKVSYKFRFVLLAAIAPLLALGVVLTYSYIWMLVLTELNWQEIFLHFFGSFTLAAVYTIIVGTLNDLLGCHEIGLLIIVAALISSLLFLEIQSERMLKALNLTELSFGSDIQFLHNNNTYICKSWKFKHHTVI